MRNLTNAVLVFCHWKNVYTDPTTTILYNNLKLCCAESGDDSSVD